MAEDEKRYRNVPFESLCLSGIWLLMLLALGKRPITQAVTWRANAIGYFDAHGLQTDEASAYRRETTFPELKL